MTPLEAAARAAWNSHCPLNKPWEEVPEIIREGKIKEQAVALLALANVKLPDYMDSPDGRGIWPHHGDGMYQAAFEIILRSIATEGKLDG